MPKDDESGAGAARGLRRGAALLGALFWHSLGKAHPPETEREQLALRAHVQGLARAALGSDAEADAFWERAEREKATRPEADNPQVIHRRRARA